MNPRANFRSYFSCIGDLLTDDTVCSMREIQHHIFVSCYEHSVFVSYVSFRLARRFGADYRAAARAGLLHDLFLYDPRDRNNYSGNQCFAHPKAALKNAAVLCGDLTPAEENSILSHMWPLAAQMPRCKVALIVSLADKLCAAVEICNLYHFACKLKTVPVPVPEPIRDETMQNAHRMPA